MSRNTLGASGTFGILEQDHANAIPGKKPAGFDKTNISAGMLGATVSNESFITMKEGVPTFDRASLAWTHMPEDKWTPQTAEVHGPKPPYVANKRHCDAYYKQMSGLGTPSAMQPAASGGPTHMDRGLGNVHHMQVPHSAHYPS